MAIGSLLLLLLLAAVYLLFPRAYVYVWRPPVRLHITRDFSVTLWPGHWVKVAILRVDSSFLDLAKPLFLRKVAKFFNQQKGNKVRAVFRMLVPREHDEGAVEPSEVQTAPLVRFADGTEVPVGTVELDGERWLYDPFAWNVEISEGEDLRWRFREVGRFRRHRLNEITLLGKAQAAWYLYREYFGEAAGEAPRGGAPKADLALPSLFLFSFLFFSPHLARAAIGWWSTLLGQVLEYVGRLLLALGPLALLAPPFYFVRLYLASPQGYVLGGILFFLAIWIVLYGLKRLFVNYIDEGVPARLELFTRGTGLAFLLWFGAVAAGILGFLPWFGVPVFPQLLTAQPFFLAAAIALLITVMYVPRPPWKVEPWSVRAPDLVAPPPEAGGKSRHLTWSAPLSQGEATFALRLNFSEETVQRWREANPFWQNWQDAAANYSSTLQFLVRELGAQQQPVLQVATYIASRMQQEAWSRVDTVQAVLSLAQAPATEYALDEECPEIKNTPEYCRSAGETLYDGRGDCDCKSALAATILRLLGFPVLGLVSAEAGHAAIAVGGFGDQEDLVGKEGVFWFEHKGARYLYCETTGENWRVGETPDPSLGDILSRPESRVELW
jgi:hypothetical protein